MSNIESGRYFDLVHMPTQQLRKVIDRIGMHKETGYPAISAWHDLNSTYHEFTLGAGPCFAGVVITNDYQIAVYHFMPTTSRSFITNKLGKPCDVMYGIVGSEPDSLASPVAKLYTQHYGFEVINCIDDPHRPKSVNLISFDILAYSDYSIKPTVLVSFNYFG